jgi:hypothetical protein
MPKDPGEFATDDQKEEYQEQKAEAEKRQKLLDIERKNEGKKALDFLSGLQGKYKVEKKEAVNHNAIAELSAQMEKVADDFRKSLEPITHIEEDIVIDAKEGKSFKLKYELSKEEKAYLSDVYTGKKDLLQKYENDIESFKKDIVAYHSRAKRESVIAHQAYNKGLEDALKDRTNPDFKGSPKLGDKDKGTINIAEIWG